MINSEPEKIEPEKKEPEKIEPDINEPLVIFPVFQRINVVIRDISNLEL